MSDTCGSILLAHPLRSVSNQNLLGAFETSTESVKKAQEVNRNSGELIRIIMNP